MKISKSKPTKKEVRKKIESAVLASEVAKAEASTRTFLLNKITPETYEIPRNQNQQPRR